MPPALLKKVPVTPEQLAREGSHVLVHILRTVLGLNVVPRTEQGHRIEQ